VRNSTVSESKVGKAPFGIPKRQMSPEESTVWDSKEANVPKYERINRDLGDTCPFGIPNGAFSNSASGDTFPLGFRNGLRHKG